MSLLLLTWLGVAAAADADLLAPTVQTLDRSLDRTEELLDRATVHLDALSAAQASWVQEGCTVPACSWRVGSALVATARAAGHEARDVVQSARMELARAERAAGAPTVAPLLDDRHRRRLAGLATRVDDAVRAWQVRVAWYERYMAGWAWRNRWATDRACADDYREASE